MIAAGDSHESLWLIRRGEELFALRQWYQLIGITMGDE